MRKQLTLASSLFVDSLSLVSCLFTFCKQKDDSEFISRQVNVERMVKLLQLYAANPEDLILKYYKERLVHQIEQQHPQGMSTSVYPIGSITIRAIVHETHLRVEVLNARHLKPLETQRCGQQLQQNKTASNNSSSTNTMSRKAFGACLASPEAEASLNFCDFHHAKIETHEVIQNSAGHPVIVFK